MDLRVPGPTPIPDEVLEAGARQMINHRGPEFDELISSLSAGAKTVFATGNDVLILSASGTGGLEAAVTNVLSPGERTAVVSVGLFGDRVVQIAEAYGADVLRVPFPEGSAADPSVVGAALRSEPGIKTVFVTHNETSTGVTNDLAALSGVIKGDLDRTLVVDGISSIASIPCPVDDLGIDIAVSSSQKGWMTPPGLTMVSVSPRAWDSIRTAKMPRFYFDLSMARDSMKKGQTPWTPALSVMYALKEGVRLLLEEGLDNVYSRHRRVGALARDRARAMGLELFADESHASDTVTALRLPKDVEWKVLSDSLRTTHSVVVAGGQGALSGKLCRIGHLGWVTEQDIARTMDSIEDVLATVRSKRAVPSRGT